MPRAARLEKKACSPNVHGSIVQFEGMVTVPNYLTPQVQVLPEELRDVRTAVNDVIDEIPSEVMDAIRPVRDAVPVDVLDVVKEAALSAPAPTLLA